MLQVNAINTYYGPSHVLFDVSLEVEAGGVVALIGRNGAGKTTTLKSIMGLVPAARGDIVYKGASIRDRRPHEIARTGIAYLPETRGIFPSLSVTENLNLVAGRRPGPWTLERIFEMFPLLKERRATGGTLLSGGEQQMLAIARSLLMNPDLLILDEPTEGLAPIIVHEIRDRLRELKTAGMTILLVEQNFHLVTTLADRIYVLGKGQIRWSGSAEEIRADEAVQREWLGV